MTSSGPDSWHPQLAPPKLAPPMAPSKTSTLQKQHPQWHPPKAAPPGWKGWTPRALLAQPWALQHNLHQQPSLSLPPKANHSDFSLFPGTLQLSLERPGPARAEGRSSRGSGSERARSRAHPRHPHTEQLTHKLVPLVDPRTSPFPTSSSFCMQFSTLSIICS